MTWEEFEKANNDREAFWFNDKRRLTEIECPKCGQKLYERLDIVLASYPPQRQFECGCGWVGYH